MTQLILDRELVAKFKGLTGKVELLDDCGRLVGIFDPTEQAGTRRLDSPFSDEEIRERSKVLSGSPLSEVLERLNKL